jgi:hypothetical protein
MSDFINQYGQKSDVDKYNIVMNINKYNYVKIIYVYIPLKIIKELNVKINKYTNMENMARFCKINDIKFISKEDESFLLLTDKLKMMNDDYLFETDVMNFLNKVNIYKSEKKIKVLMVHSIFLNLKILYDLE